MVEEKEKLSIKEFKAWLVGLIRGKKGALPDIEDWMKIKEMLDKVEEEKESLPVLPFPYQPYPQPQPNIYPWEQQKWSDPIWEKWTTDETSDKLVYIDGVSTSSATIKTSDYLLINYTEEEKNKQLDLELLWK